jgi:hypothetical protein
MMTMRTEDTVYTSARNKFIPEADRQAMRIMGKYGYSKERHAYLFNREMTRLTEKAGLIGKGNLALFDSEKVHTTIYIND